MSKKKDNKARELYTERANNLVELNKSNFDSKKLESSEKLKFIVASDIACLSLSDKRAYINGKYIGSDNDKQSDIINLDTIDSVKTAQRFRSSVKKYLIAMVITLIIFIISLNIFVPKYKETEDIMNADYHYSYHTGDSLDDYYDYYTDHDFYSKNEIAARRQDMTNNQAYFDDLYSKKQKAHSTQSYYLAGIVLTCLIGGLLLLSELLRIHRNKYMVLCIKANNKKYALEIKDTQITEQVKKIVLVAKSNTQRQITNIAQQSNMQQQVKVSGTDKISKLTELSQLYEKGLIQQEEFEKLKSELLQ